jgi:Domain of unknown function (DUF4399)
MLSCIRASWVVRSVLARWLICMLSVVASCASAQGGTAELEARCWARSVDVRTKLPSRSSTSDVNFSNITNGFKVYSPFRVGFSVRGIGVAPAGKAVVGTGHHHILVNRKLPPDMMKPLPFDKSHMHFGKGQTSATLDLPVGKHTLRLLFADHTHTPYYVFSPEVTIEVVGQRSELLDATKLKIREDKFDETCTAWHHNEATRPEPMGLAAYFQNVRDGDAVKGNFNVRFGTEGFGVCTAEISVEKTGYFELEVSQRGGTIVSRSALKKGETQLDLDLQPGSYQLQLSLLSNTGATLGPPAKINVKVRS